LKLVPRQKVWLAIVVAVNATLWLIPSDVVEEVARQRHVMLGRYSRTHFAWIVGVGVISLVSFYIDWSTGATYRRRWFQVLATLFFLSPSLVLLDFLMRTPDDQHYIRDHIAYTRPIEARFVGDYEDRPEARRSYPDAPPGFGKIDRALRTDRRGYRNAVALEQAAVVTLGDSFTEGSNVSDEHAWPARLGTLLGHPVYNLGMSGYDPLHYLEALKDHGLALHPKVVLCMLYEGNDFRSTDSDAKRRVPSFSKRVANYLDRSPVIRACDQLLIRTFGPIGADAPLGNASRIDWLPLAIPPGASARYYAFEPKQLRDLHASADEFAGDKHWLNPRGQLAEMNARCREIGATFVVLFAPTKAHVTFPLVADRVDPAKVRAFTAISMKGELPEAREFVSELTQNTGAREQVVGRWCAQEGIPFLGLTSSLRAAASAGTQVYYTYDQHWTPAGHEVVALVVDEYLRAVLPDGRQANESAAP
jgi:hypothetical protein